MVFLYLLMRAARWLLVLVSMGLELSELRVARGLATGAVDFPLASPVQRSINCNVGPWENVSNGGSLCGTVIHSDGQWCGGVKRILRYKREPTSRKPSHLSIKNGFPRGSLLADGAVLHPLHRHLVLPIQQLQSPAENRSRGEVERMAKKIISQLKTKPYLFLSKTVICAT